MRIRNRQFVFVHETVETDLKPSKRTRPTNIRIRKSSKNSSSTTTTTTRRIVYVQCAYTYSARA